MSPPRFSAPASYREFRPLAVDQGHRRGVAQLHIPAQIVARPALSKKSRGRRLSVALASWSIALALLAVAPRVRAQKVARQATPARFGLAAKKTDDAPAGAVRVVVTSNEDRVLLTVSEPGNPGAIVSCYHQCSFWGAPGSYTLRATSPERKVHYETTLSVGQRDEFNVSLGHPGARTAGLIAGIVGPVAMAGGFLLGVGHLVEERGCGEPTCPTTADYVPVAMLLSGLVTTVVGWTVYAANGPRVDGANEERASSPRPQLGVLALPRGGWGVGISTLF
jgi:hypothetical protein